MLLLPSFVWLALEHGFLHVDGNGGYQSVADVGIFLVLVVELLDGTAMCSFKAVWCVPPWVVCCPLDKGVVLFAVLVGVCEGNLDVLSFRGG